MKAIGQCNLYAFVDAAYLRGRPPGALAEMLCQGGADLIQWRAKDWPHTEVEKIARELRRITAAHGVGLVINDHLGVAQAVGADFCHLGQEDFFDQGFKHVRDLGAGDLSIGLSTHAPVQAERALAAGAAYVAIGPVFPTGTKPTARPVTLDYVRWAAAHVKVPWFAIGGITTANLDSLLEAGATRVCVVSAILQSGDVTAACRAFKVRLESARSRPAAL
jgi:thiamine-phosphate pyrophosphorylase